MNWKESLKDMLHSTTSGHQVVADSQESRRKQVNKFFSLLQAAFEEIKGEIEKHGRRVDIMIGKYACAIEIYDGNRLEFNYAVKVLRYAAATDGQHGFYDTTSYSTKYSVQRYKFAEIHKIDEQRIIRDFMRSYEKQLKKYAAEEPH